MSDLVDLRGRRALVTAASKGLGRAIAITLARCGAHVAIGARSEDALREVAAEIDGGGGGPTFFRAADLRVAHDIERLVEESAVALGGLDVVVHNAGGPRPARFTELTDEDFADAFELVLMSNVRTIRAALPHLQAAGGGAIVNVVGIGVKHALPNLVLGNAMRAGVVTLAKTLADELAPHGIRVNSVLPGSVLTDRVSSLIADGAHRAGISFDESARRRAAEIPLGRLGRPEEVGSVVAFLASDAAAFVNGTAVSVDGGIVRSVV